MNQSNGSVKVSSNNKTKLHFNIFPQLMCAIDFSQTYVIIIITEEKKYAPFDNHNQ